MSRTSYTIRANDEENQSIHDNILKVLEPEALCIINMAKRHHTWYLVNLTAIEYEKIVSYGIKPVLDDMVVGLCKK